MQKRAPEMGFKRRGGKDLGKEKGVGSPCRGSNSGWYVMGEQ